MWFLTNSSQKIRSDSRDKLYYDQYAYCLHISLQDLCALRRRTHSDIDQFCNQANWARDINYGGSWRWPMRRIRPVTDQSREHCHLALDAINSISIPYKLIINDDWGYIYTNNLDPFNDLINSPGVSVKDIRLATLDRPRDTLVIKSSVHDERTYFRNQHIELETKNTVSTFLHNCSDIRVSPSMSSWLYDYPTHRYLSDNYFIDHNSDGFLTMLQLVAQLKIKKTYKLLRE